MNYVELTREEALENDYVIPHYITEVNESTKLVYGWEILDNIKKAIKVAEVFGANFDKVYISEANINKDTGECDYSIRLEEDSKYIEIQINRGVASIIDTTDHFLDIRKARQTIRAIFCKKED